MKKEIDYEVIPPLEDGENKRVIDTDVKPAGRESDGMSHAKKALIGATILAAALLLAIFIYNN